MSFPLPHPLFRRTVTALLFSSPVAGLACAPYPPPGRVYVVAPPPRERVEVVTVAPGPGYVWAGGHWRWAGQSYVWAPGRWILPDRGRSYWVAGHWAQDRRGWYWVDGHWR
jgi:hypothetical protein